MLSDGSTSSVPLAQLPLHEAANASDIPPHVFSPSTADLGDILRCWRHQDCGTCMSEVAVACGWCAVSSTCVPLPSASTRSDINRAFPLPSILLPLRVHDICPLAREQYELRTKACGCDFSTTTVVSVITAVLATLVALIAIDALRRVISHVWRKWKWREDGWYRVWEYRVVLMKSNGRIEQRNSDGELA